METTFFARIGRLSGIIIMAMILLTSINAKILKAPIEPFTVKSEASVETNTQLLGFRGESNRQKKIVLKWNIASPELFSYNIEKSRDGENFTAVQTTGIQQDKDNSFYWTDNYPKATNCYRLKMTDAAGKSTYSKTLVIETFKSGDVELVCATPQVSLNDIQVDVQMKEYGYVNLHITNDKGEIILQQREKCKTGINQYLINGSHDLKPGDYFLKVVVNGTDRMLVHLIKE